MLETLLNATLTEIRSLKQSFNTSATQIDSQLVQLNDNYSQLHTNAKGNAELSKEMSTLISAVGKSPSAIQENQLAAMIASKPAFNREVCDALAQRDAGVSSRNSYIYGSSSSHSTTGKQGWRERGCGCRAQRRIHKCSWLRIAQFDLMYEDATNYQHNSSCLTAEEQSVRQRNLNFGVHWPK
jgi:hypothetical protein